jgi:endonuclease/exonuclease/phosphatase (EEP) superfamily protein YafD
MRLMAYVTKSAVKGFCLLGVALLAVGCVSVPKESYLLSLREGSERVTRAAACGAGEPGGFVPARGADGIDPGKFTLFNWNMMKGGRQGWEDDFLDLAGGADLLTIQEAYLTKTLSRVLRQGRYQWDLTAAFLNRRRETGVLTGSRGSPVYSCAFRFPEPLTALPKTILASFYPIAGMDELLLVANVHLINYTMGTKEYRRQLRELEDLLALHQGPLILLGDFNTWSDARMAEVAGVTERMALRAVDFVGESLSPFLGRIVDHVYYRGLEAIDARAVEVSTSDHNPLLVTFRVL